MNVFKKTLISESTALTAVDIELDPIDLADVRNATLGVIGLEFIGVGTVNIQYSSTLTEGDSTWKSLGFVTLLSGIRQTVYMPTDEPHFGQYYKFKINGVGSTVESLIFGMV